MEQGFEYYAFISYKREDEKLAKWLQNKLEGYRLPSVIRKEVPRLPKRIRPIFRDKTDLGAGLLTDSLRNELEKSRYLIVVCSPQAAKSEWVGKEISAFIEMGRADRIIPFIVSGEPNSNSEQECFHPVIKEKVPETLGINVNEIGKQQAFVKVAAKLLDLRFDTLWNRFQRQQRKNRIIAAIAGLLLLLSIGYIWDYNRTKVEYYADYVERYNKGTGAVVEGVVELNRSQIKRRNAHYRFEYSQRKLRKVVNANSAGTSVEHINTEYIDRPSIQEFIYTDGKVSITELKNSRNKTIASYYWGGKNLDRIDIKTSKEDNSSMTPITSFTSISTNLFGGKNSEAKAEIKRFNLTRDASGYVVRKEFMKHNGENIPACDASGIWGFVYYLDSL
ncbi:MAG: toll/interleukin-1 receptor domain-containing protein, partial [Bacteroidales bacterium]|nr:toll/interleukin-1 receptor domain-containing protein [Bacteroidales bacterium]